MARKVIDIIYNLVRKRLTLKGDGTGITSLPDNARVKRGMENVFKRLKEGGYNPVTAEKAIQSEDDLARVLEEINQKEQAILKLNLFKQQRQKEMTDAVQEVMDKMATGKPLNPLDRKKLESSGFKVDASKDMFKGFEPRVIPGGKKPRDKKFKGGITAAVKKLKKKFGKDIIQKGKAPKKSEKKKLQDLFREFNRKNKAGGGLAYMLGEPRENFGDGGMSRRTFLKIMAALAAFPVVGKLTKLTKVAKGTAPLVTKTSEMPEHFPKLVEKILREGQVVDSQFIKKTGNVKTYRHPDRPDMELTVEGDGNRIQLDFDTDQGMRGGYEFKKGVPDETVSKPPDEFEAGEVKYRMSQDGESYSKDFELGIDTGTENLDEFVGIKKQKTSKSKVNLPESLDDDFAEGGLAGLLGE